jgi:hypothetical protein
MQITKKEKKTMPRIFKSFMPRVHTYDPDAAVVRMAVNGLALLCFSNLDGGRAEVGFLNTATHHPLLFSIFDKNCNLIYPTGPEPVELPAGTEISINHNNAGLGQIYAPDKGDLPDQSDNRDFRHLLNLDEFHKEAFKVEKVPLIDNYPFLGKLFLYNGLFFTAKRSQRPAKIRTIAGRVLPLPRVGKIIGADIADAEVGVRIGSQELPPLTRDENSPYTIVIRYKCEDDDHTETDFQLFHEVLNTVPEHVMDIFYDGIEPAGHLGCERSLQESLKNREFTEDHEKAEIFSKLLSSYVGAEEACQASTKPECPLNLRGVPEPCP